MFGVFGKIISGLVKIFSWVGGKVWEGIKVVGGIFKFIGTKFWGGVKGVGELIRITGGKV